MRRRNLRRPHGQWRAYGLRRSRGLRRLPHGLRRPRGLRRFDGLRRLCREPIGCGDRTSCGDPGGCGYPQLLHAQAPSSGPNPKVTMRSDPEPAEGEARAAGHPQCGRCCPTACPIPQWRPAQVPRAGANCASAAQHAAPFSAATAGSCALTARAAGSTRPRSRPPPGLAGTRRRSAGRRRASGTASTC